MASGRKDLDTLNWYFQAIEGSNGLSREEEVRLAKLVKQGDEEAMATLASANLMFVVRIAKEYQNHGLTLAELISAGNLGLLVAVRRFDSVRGFKFISYAVWWIRQAIKAALAEEPQVVNLPTNRFGELVAISKKLPKLAQKLGRTPTADDVAKAMEKNIPDREVINLLMAAAKGAVHLDNLCDEYDKNSGTLIDLLESDSPDSDRETIERESEAQLEHLLSCLDERQRRIIDLCFGLNGYRALTLEQIGGMMGLTKERIRQIRNQALGKVRDRAKRLGISMSLFAN